MPIFSWQQCPPPDNVLFQCQWNLETNNPQHWAAVLIQVRWRKSCMHLLKRIWREFTFDNILSPTVNRCRLCDWTHTTWSRLESAGVLLTDLELSCHHGYFKWIRLTRPSRNRPCLSCWLQLLLPNLTQAFHFSPTLFNIDQASPVLRDKRFHILKTLYQIFICFLW